MVAIHLTSFPGFFMTRCGPRFLAEYYHIVLSYSPSVFLVAVDEGQVVGFVAGFLEPAGFYALLRKQRLRLAMALLPQVVRTPSLVARLLTNSQRAAQASTATGDKVAELASLAVHPDHARKGYGSALVRSFIDAAASRSAREVILTTDAQGNDAVNQFYMHLGFTVTRTVTPVREREMNEYRYLCSEEV